MSDTESRLTDLEIRYTHQERLLEELSTELYKANEKIDVLMKTVRDLSASVRQLADMQPLPPNEKPPHY